MALKPKTKRRILWTTVSIIAAVFLAIIIIPPMITLNQFKPMIERAIYEQMAVPAKLNGDIRFSLIGGATIVANDVTVPTAHIGAVLLSVPEYRWAQGFPPHAVLAPAGSEIGKSAGQIGHEAQKPHPPV